MSSITGKRGILDIPTLPPGMMGYPRVMNAIEVRRWIAGFEAIAEADRQELRRHRADPAWAIALALSMIGAAERAGHGAGGLDQSRDAEDAGVRATWVRLREHLLRERLRS